MSARPVPPPVPYGATAVRPSWADLPAELRAAVTGRLGAPVVAADGAGGGFTAGFAGVLSTADGDRVFVKAAALADPARLGDLYAREAAITAALPVGVPAARPRWTLTVAGHFVLCLDAVDGRVPVLPWTPDELAATLSGYAEAAAALRRPPPALVGLGLPSLADLAREHLTGWQEVAAHESTARAERTARPEPAPPRGPEPLPEPEPPHEPGVTGLAEIARLRLPELAALEASLPERARRPEMIHGDLRVDNVLIDRDGAAWLCDWTWAGFGPAWFDLTGLLVTAHASGLDADALYAAQPAAHDAPADALDVSLAALSGHWLTAAAAGGDSASPYLRAHQRWSGEMALSWLARRRGWC